MALTSKASYDRACCSASSMEDIPKDILFIDDGDECKQQPYYEFTRLFKLSQQNMCENNCDQLNGIKQVLELNKKSFENLFDSIENTFRFYEEDVEMRVMSIENDLDKLIEEFNAKLDTIKHRSCQSHKKLKLISDKKKKIDKVRTQFDKMEKLYHRLRLFNMFIEGSTLNNGLFRVAGVKPSDDSLIGEIVHPYPSKYDKIKKITPVMFPAEMPVCLAYLSCMDQLLITDPDAHLIRVIDSNGNYVNAINPENLLEKPATICISDQNEIYVEDMIKEKIFVFSSELKYLRQFGDERLQTPFCMQIDNETSLLYLSAYLNNTITVWSGTKCEFVSEFELNSPLSISIMHDKIFVISAIDIELFTLKTSVHVTENNDNCIYVLDKKTHNLLRIVKINRCIHPKGLVVDAELNFFIAAVDLQSIKEESNEGKAKPCKYLIKLNQNGEFVQKTRLGISGTFNMIFFHKKVAFTRGYRNPPLYIIDFK